MLKVSVFFNLIFSSKTTDFSSRTQGFGKWNLGNQILREKDRVIGRPSVSRFTHIRTISTISCKPTTFLLLKFKSILFLLTKLFYCVLLLVATHFSQGSFKSKAIIALIRTRDYDARLKEKWPKNRIESFKKENIDHPRSLQVSAHISHEQTQSEFWLSFFIHPKIQDSREVWALSMV